MVRRQKSKIPTTSGARQLLYREIPLLASQQVLEKSSASSEKTVSTNRQPGSHIETSSAEFEDVVVIKNKTDLIRKKSNLLLQQRIISTHRASQGDHRPKESLITSAYQQAVKPLSSISSRIMSNSEQQSGTQRADLLQWKSLLSQTERQASNTRSDETNNRYNPSEEGLREIRVDPQSYRREQPTMSHTAVTNTSGGSSLFIDKETQTSFSGVLPGPVKSAAFDVSRTQLTRRQSHASAYAWTFHTKTHTTINPTEDELQEEKIQVGKKYRYDSKSREVNIRAQMSCCRLLCHDIKLWYKRRAQIPTDTFLFREQIKLIEGHFGSGVVSFFVFTRWIILLNLLLSIVWLGAVVLPQATGFSYDLVEKPFYIKNFLDGQNYFESIWLFYGGFTTWVSWYPMAALYLTAVLITYFGSFFFIIRSLAIAIGEEGGPSIKNSRFSFGLVTFGSWDHSLQSDEAILNLSTGIVNQLRDHLSEVNRKSELQKWTKKQRNIIWFRRTLAWLLTVLLIGGGCGTIFFLVTQGPLEMETGVKALDNLLVVYSTTISFSLINICVPFCIHKLPQFEKYVSGKVELNISIGRVFVLRMANLFALIVSLYYKVHSGTFHGCVGTLIGQELYKLVIVDTLLQVVIQLLGCFLIFYWKGEKAEFKMSKAVLVVVYRQALIWTGAVACPVLPVVGLLSILVFFLTNYAIVRTTCRPPTKRWNQSRHSTFFLGLLAATLACLLLPVSAVIGRQDVINLSEVGGGAESCGPFGNQTMLSAFQLVKTSLHSESPILAEIVDFLTSGTIMLPLIFVLLAMLYYQKLRIRWTNLKHVATAAELEQECLTNRDLRRKLHLSAL